MSAMLSDAGMNAGHGLAMHLHTDLREARTNNGWLIFCDHGVTERPAMAEAI